MLFLHNMDWPVSFKKCDVACCFSIMWISMLIYIMWIGMLLHNVDRHVSFIQCDAACCFSIMWISMLLFYNVDLHVVFT